MRANLLILLLSTALVGICLIFFLKGQPPQALQGYKTNSGFHYEVVTDPVAQARGLGGRPEVPENYGMLFVFPKDGSYGFWMKDMLVPIDIIWLSDNGTIVGIDPDVATSTYPNVFYPPEPVRYVLETRSGEAVRQGFSIGLTLSLPSQK